MTLYGFIILCGLAYGTLLTLIGVTAWVCKRRDRKYGLVRADLRGDLLDSHGLDDFGRPLIGLHEASEVIDVVEITDLRRAVTIADTGWAL